MVHIGEKSFYDNVQKELNASDKIIYEGVESNKWYHNFSSYKNVGKKLGLISQNEGLNFINLKEKLIHVDIDATDWDNEFSKIPFKIKLLHIFLNPILRFLFLFKFFQNKFIKMDNVEDVTEYDDVDKKDYYFQKRRDQVILEKIDNIYHSLKDEKNEYIISLIYGAKHCPYIFHRLSEKYNFKIIKAKYLTVYNNSSI